MSLEILYYKCSMMLGRPELIKLLYTEVDKTLLVPEYLENKTKDLIVSFLNKHIDPEIHGDVTRLLHKALVINFEYHKDENNKIIGFKIMSIDLDRNKFILNLSGKF